MGRNTTDDLSRRSETIDFAALIYAHPSRYARKQNMTYAIIGIICAAIVFTLVLLYRKQITKSEELASDYTRMLLPLWALLGPYETAEDSANAFGLCLFTLTSKGDSDTLKFSNEKIKEMMDSHRVAYAKDPAAWTDLLGKSKEHIEETHITLAEEIEDYWRDEFPLKA